MFSVPLPVAFSLDFTSLSSISFIAGSTKAVSHDEEDLHCTMALVRATALRVARVHHQHKVLCIY